MKILPFLIVALVVSLGASGQDYHLYEKYIGKKVKTVFGDMEYKDCSTSGKAHQASAVRLILSDTLEVYFRFKKEYLIGHYDCNDKAILKQRIAGFGVRNAETGAMLKEVLKKE